MFIAPVVHISTSEEESNDNAHTQMVVPVRNLYILIMHRK